MSLALSHQLRGMFRPGGHPYHQQARLDMSLTPADRLTHALFVIGQNLVEVSLLWLCRYINCNYLNLSMKGPGHSKEGPKCHKLGWRWPIIINHANFSNQNKERSVSKGDRRRTYKHARI